MSVLRFAVFSALALVVWGEDVEDDVWDAVDGALRGSAGEYGNGRQLAGVGRHIPVPQPPGRLENMPELHSLLELFVNWPPDDPVIPERIFDTLKHLDFQSPEDYDTAIKLRNLEIPFVVFNVPTLNSAVEKFRDDEYVINGMGRHRTYQVHRAPNNHFMYYLAGEMRQEMNAGNRPARGYRTSAESATAYRPSGYTFPYAPPVPTTMTFEEFWRKTDDIDAAHPRGPDQDYEHMYLTTGDNWAGPGNTVIGKDLRIFRTEGPEKNLFLRDASDVRGIHARIGMRGVQATSHYDGHLNFIAMLRGEKRYVLSPPSACQHLEFMEKGPSRRHAGFEFGAPDVLNARGEDGERRAANLMQAKGLEVVLRAGDVLYLPSWWLHHIISLGRSVQGNVRSGVSPTYGEDADGLNKCELGDHYKPSPQQIQDAKEFVRKYGYGENLRGPQ